ncbi:MAG: TrmB family transcriptional regulator [Calditrichia bacterium]
MDHLEHIDAFKDAGLTEREAKVYMTLLTKSVFTASELQETVDIPRTKIYEVLQKMVQRGICIESRVGVKKVYQAVEPELAFGRMRKQYELEALRKTEVLEKLSTIFTPVFEEGKLRKNSEDYIEVFRDKNLIHRKYVSLVKQTSVELLTFNKGPYAWNSIAELEEQDHFEDAIVKKGGTTRGIYEHEELRTIPLLSTYTLEQIKNGHEARMAETLPVKMLVFDGKAVMFALDSPDPDSSELTMIAIEHKSIAAACRILFNSIWTQARVLDDALLASLKDAVSTLSDNN